MATEKKGEQGPENEGKTAKLKPGFIWLHHPERRLERQVSLKNQKGLIQFEQAGYKKGRLTEIVPPAEAKKA